MNKILTVSIAAYNVEKFLRMTLDSLVNNEIMDVLEVLIVNDGSTDSTPEIAKEYQDKYPDTFRLIDKENGGWGSTVNYGLKNSHGKYFKLLDGDDYFTNIDAFVRALQEIDADMVYNPYIVFYDDSEEIELHSIKEDAPIGRTVDLEYEFLTGRFGMHHCTFKTSVIKDRITISENCFYTDEEFVMLSVENVKTVHFCPIEVYAYRMGRAGQSVSMASYRKHYLNLVHVTTKLLKRNTCITDINIKKLYNEKIKTLVSQTYLVFLNLEPTEEHARELYRFDQLIKQNYREFYATTRKRIKVFRLLGIKSYKSVVYK